MNDTLPLLNRTPAWRRLLFWAGFAPVMLPLSGVAAAQTPAASSSPSARPPVKAAVAARVSTLGAGLEGSVLASPALAVRVGFGSYSYSHTANYQDIDYDGKLKLNNIEATADFYPAVHSPFHLSAGLVFDSNKLTGHGKPAVSGSGQTYTLNGTTYSASDVGSLDANVTFSKTAPYLGLGFGKPSGSGSGLQFLFDLGVIFQGKPHLTLSRSGGTTDPAASAIINTAVSAQRDKTQSDVNKYQYYPVVSFGLSYGF